MSSLFKLSLLIPAFLQAVGCTTATAFVEALGQEASSYSSSLNTSYHGYSREDYLNDMKYCYKTNDRTTARVLSNKYPAYYDSVMKTLGLGEMFGQKGSASQDPGVRAFHNWMKSIK